MPPAYGRREGHPSHRHSRTGRATFTASWLLSVWSIVIDTFHFSNGHVYHVFGGFFIVAMSMIDRFVAEIILSPQGGRDAVIDFQQVFILKVEPASWALPLLYLEQFCLLVVHEWMLFEPLCPVEEVSVKGACSSLYLCVVLALRFRMEPDIDRLWVSYLPLDIHAKPDLSGLRINVDPVFSACCLFACTVMPRFAPSCELPKGVVITGCEYL
jgi:drug/metabolite transporter superfamily protein YnfA